MKFNLEMNSKAKIEVVMTPEEFIKSLFVIKEMQSEVIANPNSVSALLNSYAEAINKTIRVFEVRK